MKIKKKIYISLLIAMVAIIALVSSLYVNHANADAAISYLALSNVDAIAENESGGSDKVDVRCETCISPENYPGVRFLCKTGTGGCYETLCVSGDCGD